VLKDSRSSGRGRQPWLEQVDDGKSALAEGRIGYGDLCALAVMAACARSSGQTEQNDKFVQRD
jgi:hypothetical protein